MAKKETKTEIKPDLGKYTKTKNAAGVMSHNNGDSIATTLVGLTVDEVASVASKVIGCTAKELKEKYSHLNVGQQRMNMGNRIRGAVAKANKAEAGSGDKALTEAAAPARKKADARAQKEAKAKAKAA